ncbi:hypothetical protein QMK19_35175 [Streptomyces sp. H10-C2]|uniref:hypothetical protein n=1 Tax=unclassified Streptomyces TaxID=2593676 RepID=UPI0024BBE1F4|nr:MULTISPECIES: hypothetical protein [unclassified Streptomyces]MDJ0345877.1 hypothetical protein [Streptomyces sp. PH10-H1]MDJ0374726.1 hypothetical protein [Streptomyces sp. H10-C2]
MVITLAQDGHAWVDGVEVPLDTGATVDHARAAALGVVADIAHQEQRVIPVEAVDPDAAVWRLQVHPDGRVEDSTAAARQLTADPMGRVVPQAYRDQVRETSAASDRGRGVAPAQQLLAQVVAEHGEDHPYALQAQELQAHAELLSGDPAAATATYTAAAIGWAQLGSHGYWGAAQSAYCTWHHVDDVAGAVWAGEQIVAMLRLGGADAGALAALRIVLARIDAMYEGTVE